jgi:hypothetical protein
MSFCKTEMIIKQERIVRSKKKNAINSKYNGGFMKFGYYVNPNTKEYEINEDEAKIIRLIYNNYEFGWGQRKLYRELKERGICQCSKNPARLYSIRC